MLNSLETKFLSFLHTHFPSGKYGRWLLAVSGGMDSVALVNLCKKHGVEFGIAHCNFQLRHDESTRDEWYVEMLAKEEDVPFFVKKFNTKQQAESDKTSTQLTARTLRYQWFQEIAASEGYTAIATAHHANDNVETVIMNMFRGTGIKGLRGIQATQGNLIRPLLQASKKEIENFAKNEQLNWVEDSSNASDKYTRNYVRHHIVSLMENVYESALQNFEQTISHLHETELLYNQAIEIHKKKLLVFKGNEIHIPILKLKKIQPLATILFEILQPYDFKSNQINDAISLLDKDTGAYLQSSTHRLIKNRNWVIIAPNATEAAQHILIESFNENINFHEGRLALKLVKDKPPVHTEKTMAQLDANALKLPLLLRPWKAGDYFYPLGMKKKKKVSRFLIDDKLSKTDKEKIWVLVSNQHIVWVVGLRIDDRCKLTDKTKETVQINFTTIAETSK